MADQDISFTVSLKDLVAGAFDDIAGGLNRVADATDRTKGSAETAGGVWSGLFQKMSDDAGGAGELVSQAFEHPLDAVKNLGSGIQHEIIDRLGPLLGPAVEVAAAALTGLAAVFYETGKAATETGASIERVALTTGIAVPKVSDLKFAFESTGGSLDQVNTMMFMFEQRMVNSSRKVDDGLHMIGLSLADIEQQSPDERILAISDAMQHAAEGTNVAAAAFDIFGRQGRTALPQLMQPLSELTQLSKAMGNTWSGEDADAALKLELAIKTMGVSSNSVWTQMGRDIEPITGKIELIWPSIKLLTSQTVQSMLDQATAWGWLGFAIDTVSGKVQKVPTVTGDAKKGLDAWTESVKNNSVGVASMEDATRAWDETGQTIIPIIQKHIDLSAKHEQALQKEKDALLGDTASTKLQIEALDQLIRQSDLTWETEQRMADLITKLEAKNITLTESIYGWQAANASLFPTVDRLAEATKKSYEMGQEFHVGVSQSILDTTEWDGALIDLQDNAFGPLYQKTMPGVVRGYDEINKKGKEFLQGIIDQRGQTRTFSDELVALFQTKLPDTIMKAVEGGGSVWGAVGLAIGQKIGGKLTDYLSGIFSPNTSGDNVQYDAQGNALPSGFQTSGAWAGAGAMGAVGIASALTAGGKGRGATVAGDAAKGAQIGTMIMPGWGTAIGAGVGALVGAFSVTQQEKDARKAHDDWTAAVIANFEKIGTKQEQLEAGGVAWKEVNIAVRDAYIAAGLSGTQAMHDLDLVNQATHKSAADVATALQKINGIMGDAKQDQDDLNAAIKQYGFSIQELGPAMQKQQLTQQATTLENQWRLLVASGINVETVTTHMSSALNDYLHVSMQTGQDVPKEMQPIIQKMIDMGNLTDLNGNKITDLGSSGLTFSETMTQGFDRIVKKLQEVVDKINGVSTAVNQAPTSHTLDWVTRYSTEGAPPGPGGDFGGAQAAGGDYFVTKPTYFLAGEAGPEWASFSGGGKGRAGGFDDSRLVAAFQSGFQQLARAMQSLSSDLPRAVRDGVLLAN
jgi:hypothetical protein